ncbi:uncharacterized protein LOC101241534 isoform X5 [Hydra vulgaris]|uniref:Uncharacterized protein LOC101241534 isoform X5 n=1 Tax=Hydra vulgaris TaxID=6087 RepID=A0ABM4CK71_HYDVU
MYFSGLNFILIFCFVLLKKCYCQDGNFESKCFKHFKEVNDGLSLLGQFVPSCEPDGRYSKKQCHENYCFCVNQETGEKLKNAERSEDIICEDLNLRIYGKVVLPNPVLLNESCLRMTVREDILCQVEECDIPIVAQLEVKNPLVNSDGTILYEIVLKNPKLTPHIIEAVLNNGWCKSQHEQVWIKYGDFNNDVAHNITPLPKQSVLKFDVKLIEYKDSETEICPKDVPIVSCGLNPCKKLSCVDYPAAVCKPNYCGGCTAEFFVGETKVDCKNTSCNDICPLLYDPKCASNGVEYSNLCSFQLAQCKDNTITLAKDGPCQTDLRIYGKLVLPNPAILKGSCLSITIKENILCGMKKCDIPIIDIIEARNPVVSSDGEIFYEFILKNPKSTPHVIEAVLNNGWCKGQHEKVWVKYGDYKNDALYIINPLPNLTVLEVDIKMKEYVRSETACEKLAAKKKLPGSFVPKCNADGSFEKQQCHSSTGFCWCAHPKTGIAIDGTSTTRDQIPFECNSVIAFSPSCIKNCEKDYNPVCGSNDETYTNVCELRNAQCHDSTIKYAYSGKCAECSGPISACGFKPCARLFCNDYPEAVCKPNFCGGCNAEFFNNGVKVECENKTCLKFCPFDYNPKCGSNGVEYPNLCHLEIAQCKDNSIILANNGPCQTDYSDVGQEIVPETSSCQIACPEEGTPVCGTDYYTYPNLCMLKNAQCQNQTIKYVHNGSCIECSDDVPTPACGFKPCNKLTCLDYPEAVCKPNYCGDCKADFYLDGKKVQCNNTKCNKECPLNEYKPKCGSNGVQYMSLCFIEVAQCEDNSLMIEFDGQCSNECPEDAPTPACGFKPCDKLTCLDYPDAVCKPNYCGGCKAAFYLDGKKVQCNNTKCNKECPDDEDNPKCGSNGVQYKNLCSILVAQCEDNNLMIEFDGPCQKEVSGSVILPQGATLKEGSCLMLTLQEAIKCDEVCDIPVLASYNISDPHVSTSGTIQYKMAFNYLKLMPFTIKAEINNGWCSDPDTSKRYGDFYTKFSHTIHPLPNQAKVDFNVTVIEFKNPRPSDTPEITCVQPCSNEHKPVCGSDGKTYINLCEFSNAQCKNKDLSIKHYFTCKDDIEIVLKTIEVSGLVKFPQNISLKPSSCLSMTLHEGLYCKGITCNIPVLASYHANNLNVDASHTIHYKMSFNYSIPTSYIVRAVVNNGWCKDNDNSIKYGDYHNEYTHTIHPLLNQEKIDFDVTLVEYKDPLDECLEKSTECIRNKCQDSTCPGFPLATCVFNKCSCVAEFYINGSKVNCISEYQPAVASDNSEISNEILVENSCAFKCTDNYDPVCGSDRRTHSSLCTMLFSACSTNSKIFKIHNGVCGHCKTACTRELMPQCGSDGITYTNKCEMEKKICESNGQVKNAYNGSCDKPYCPDVCTGEFSPQCGSDRKTYNNMCMLQTASCSSSGKIKFLHEGQCQKCLQICTKEWDPYCGSDDETYGNLCLMNHAICESAGSLQIKYAGSCSSPTCPKSCPQGGVKVCGTDNNTYINLCELQKITCQNKEVYLNYIGECRGKCLSSMCQIEEVSSICGSDGQTYSRCLFRRAQCLAGGEIRVAYKENCRKTCGGQKMPVRCKNSCSSVFCPSYPSATCIVDRCNSCQAKFMLLSKDVTNDCGSVCNEVCNTVFDPICANNGLTYENECFLNVARCKSKGKIKLAYRGECKLNYL